MPIGPISFMTANFVARESGWQIADWGDGDRATNEAFRDPATYAQRLAGLLDEAVALGFDAIDLWDAHLHRQWATDEQIETARRLLDERGLAVASLAGWMASTLDELDVTCRIAHAVGTDLLAGGTSLVRKDRRGLIAALERHGVRLAIENHPERTPDEILELIGDDADGRVGTAVDTGWWGTQGYDAAEAIRELGPHVMHVHLKDVREVGTHDSVRYGEGVVPIEACVRALEEIGYTGGISIEHEPFDRDPRPDVAEHLRLVRGWLSAS